MSVVHVRLDMRNHHLKILVDSERKIKKKSLFRNLCLWVEFRITSFMSRNILKREQHLGWIRVLWNSVHNSSAHRYWWRSRLHFGTNPLFTNCCCCSTLRAGHLDEALLFGGRQRVAIGPRPDLFILNIRSSQRLSSQPHRVYTRVHPLHASNVSTRLSHR